jgi:hypothetical protein
MRGAGYKFGVLRADGDQGVAPVRKLGVPLPGSAARTAQVASTTTRLRRWGQSPISMEYRAPSPKGMIASKDMVIRSTAVLFALACTLYGQPGPAVGAKAPDFEAVDQNGQTRTLRSLTGRKGLMLVFYRSADW